MSGLAKAVTELADVIERENDALRRMDLPGATALLPAKRNHLAAFERAGAAASADGRQDPTLRPIVARLMEASAENKQLLERAMKAQQRIMSLLAQAARNSTPLRHYGSRGAYVSRGSGSAFGLSARA